MNKKEQKKLLIEIMEADAKDGLYETVTNNHRLTAMEKLFEWIDSNIHEESFNINDSKVICLLLEKEQIINAYEAGWVNGDLKKAPRFGSDYYNEKFNNE
jgi:transposase